jgi:hypothetical protein
VHAPFSSTHLWEPEDILKGPDSPDKGWISLNHGTGYEDRTLTLLSATVHPVKIIPVRLITSKIPDTVQQAYPLCCISSLEKLR